MDTLLSKALQGAAMIHFAETKYGFEYGPAKVTRVCSDEAQGWVVLCIETPKQKIEAYVTKTGKVRVSSERGEWTPPEVFK